MTHSLFTVAFRHKKKKKGVQSCKVSRNDSERIDVSASVALGLAGESVKHQDQKQQASGELLLRVFFKSFYFDNLFNESVVKSKRAASHC